MWQQDNSTDPAYDDVRHVAVDPEGAVGTADPVTSNWAGVSQPALILMPDGSLRTFFGGIRTTQSGEPNQNLNTATAPQSGSPWNLFIGTVVTGDAAYASDTGAAVTPDGTPFQTWSGTGEIFVHRGLDPATPNFPYNENLNMGGNGLHSELAVDGGTGALWVGWWYHHLSGSPTPEQIPGVYVQEVDPATGDEVGPPNMMPGTSTTFNGRADSINTGAHLQITGRPPTMGGIFVAHLGGYPTANRVLLWQVGDGESTVLDRAENVSNPAIAAAPDGSLWVLWEQPNHAIAARRSTPDLTSWSPKITINAPAGSSDIWKLAADAGPNTVDVVATVTDSSGSSEIAAFHTRITNPIGGTEGSDVLTGTSGNDVMFGGGGGDTINGGDGNDKLDGGAGNDKLEGGPGTDVLNGGPGKDRCVISKAERKKAKSCETKVIKRNNM